MLKRIRKLLFTRQEALYWNVSMGGYFPVLDNYLRKRYMKRAILANGSYIGNPMSFKTKPIFPHGICGIFISGSAKIGEECIIFQQVTIGSNYLPGSSNIGAPSIGDNVYIGAGAKIIGRVHIGNNCRIGANAVVFQDVPDNCTVVSGSPRIIPSERGINRYYSMNSEGKWIEIHSNYTVETEIVM